MVTFSSFKLIPALLCIALFSGCATVNFDVPKSSSHALIDTDDTLLGQYVSKWVQKHKGKSGVYPFEQGMDALGARLYLANQAEKSIDLQYFLMKDDTAGFVVTNVLLKAADRGVRVRFLLDDIFTSAEDRTLLLMNEHPNIEVRIFNPVSRRGWSWLNFISDFSQANRRMHNKSFTVDNQYSVVGGRNIADEYFELTNHSEFFDLDMLVAGPIVNEISNSFDDFWNHSRSVPINHLSKVRQEESLETVRAEANSTTNAVYDSVFNQALDSSLLQDLIDGKKEFYPAKVTVIVDSPDKLVNEIDVKHMKLANELGNLLTQAKQEIIFITPYFVPGDYFLSWMKSTVDKGVHVVVLTNSLASTNHVPVHSGYARYRKDVIRAGVELYEIRADAVSEQQDSEEGPSAITLHTKAILIDRRQILVGSLNLDPRSIEINSEFGLLVDSADMVGPMVSDLKTIFPEVSYRVVINNNESLEWHGNVEGKKVIEHKEPLTNGWRRFKAWLSKIVPASQL